MPNPTICTVSGNVKNLLGAAVTGCTVKATVSVPFFHPTGGSWISGELESTTSDGSGNFSLALIETATPVQRVLITFSYYDGVQGKKSKAYSVVIPNQSTANLVDLVNAAVPAPINPTSYPASSVTVSAITGVVATNVQAAIAELYTDITTVVPADLVLASTKIIVGNGSGVGAAVNMSGDATIANTGAVTLATNVVDGTKFRQGVAKSVVGVAGNATANVADVAGTTDQVLRVTAAGTGLGFGSINLAASACVGATLLPVTNGGLGVSLGATGGTSQVLKQTSVGGNVQVAQLAFTDISGSVAAAQLPNPSASTLGGVESLAAVASNWINTISTSGVPSATQPAFTDISGAASTGQIPNLAASKITSGTLAVAQGGTNLASGTSGGILAYTAAGTLASSAALTANQLIVGGGVGVVPLTLAAGSQYQVLRMGATTPAYGTINLDQGAAVTGILPVTLGGVGASLGATGGTSQVLKQTSVGGNIQVAQLAFSDLSGSATGAQLPNPSASTLGGVESLAAVSHNFLTSISTSGVPAAAQPAFTDISGSVAAGQMPAHTGDVTSSAGAVALTIAANAVTDAKFRQGVARSLVGVTGNATANTADIQGTTDQVLRVTGAGTALSFGSIDLSKSAAVGATILAVGNGGAGVSLGATGGTSQVLKQTSVGGNVQVAQLAFTDISGATTAAQAPAMIAVAANQNSGNHATSGTWITVGTGATLTVATDTNSAMTTSGVFTAPVAGYYLFTGCVTFTANGVGVRHVRLNKNSGTIVAYGSGITLGSVSIDAGQAYCAVLNLALNDTIQVQTFQTSGGALNYGTNSMATTIFINKIWGT